MRLAFYGVDQWGRPNFPPFDKLWIDEGGYKGFLWRCDENKFYFNDIPERPENHYNALSQMAFKEKKFAPLTCLKSNGLQ